MPNPGTGDGAAPTADLGRAIVRRVELGARALPPRLARLRRRELPGGLGMLEGRGLRARLLGLAHLEEPPPGHGLRLPRCGSVHTMGMRFPLDVIFLDGNGEVLRVARAVPPRRFLSTRGARTVIETRAGEADGFLAATGARPPERARFDEGRPG